MRKMNLPRGRHKHAEFFRSQSESIAAQEDKLVSILGTSVPSERLFSSAGNLITNKRNRLLTENVDKRLFLYENS